MPPIPFDRLTPEAVPDAWKDGQTTALALSIALAGQEGHPIPWAVTRRAIEDAIRSRWMELAPESGSWPCEMASASAVTLRQPAPAPDGDRAGIMDQWISHGYLSQPKGVYTSSSELRPSALQDLVDVLLEIVKAAAGIPLQFHLSVTLGDGREIGPDTVESINRLLEEVDSDIRLTTRDSG